MWIAACAHATSKSRHLVAFRQCSGMFSIQRGWAQQALAAEPSARHHQHTQPALPATALLPQPQRASILRLLGGQHARALQLPPPEAAGTALAPQPAQERFFASKRASKGPATPPDLLNKTFTFDSVTVKKVRARKDRGWASLSVTLTPEQWSSLEPSLQQAVRWRRAQGAAINTNTAIAHQMMKSRTISMRGYGLSKIGEGCMMWVQGTWRSNDMVGMELEISSFQELEITCLQGEGWVSGQLGQEHIAARRTLDLYTREPQGTLWGKNTMMCVYVCVRVVYSQRCRSVLRACWRAQGLPQPSCWWTSTGRV